MPTTYNKVTAGNQTLIDLSQDTVTQSDHIVSGYVGHLANGQQVTGTGGGGGTTDYTDLTNKPQINSVTLTGNKSLSDLGIQPGVGYVETVSGTTPTITGQANTRYVCGEVSTISITPPANGSCIVRFTSGTTATVMTVPNTVKWPDWFDATALESNTVYEVCIEDGVYGGAIWWQG